MKITCLHEEGPFKGEESIILASGGIPHLKIETRHFEGISEK